MRIRWTPDAANDLEHISAYIGKDSTEAALKVARSLYEGVALLSRFPYRGRIGEVKNSRELVLAPLPYVVYEIKEQTVVILHGAQDWR